MLAPRETTLEPTTRFTITTKAPITTTEAPTGVIISTPTCPKCGVNKRSGKLSCCASGGAWFKNCGHGDDPVPKDHTWGEGTEACQGNLMWLKQ